MATNIQGCYLIWGQLQWVDDCTPIHEWVVGGLFEIQLLVSLQLLAAFLIDVDLLHMVSMGQV